MKTLYRLPWNYAGPLSCSCPELAPNSSLTTQSRLTVTVTVPPLLFMVHTSSPPPRVPAPQPMHNLASHSSPSVSAYSPAHNMHLVAAGCGRRKPRKLCTPAHCRSRRRQRRSRRCGTCGWRRCGWRRRRPCRRRSRCYLHTLNPGDPIIPSTQNTQIQS